MIPNQYLCCQVPRRTTPPSRSLNLRNRLGLSLSLRVILTLSRATPRLTPMYDRRPHLPQRSPRSSFALHPRYSRNRSRVLGVPYWIFPHSCRWDITLLVIALLRSQQGWEWYRSVEFVEGRACSGALNLPNILSVSFLTNFQA